MRKTASTANNRLVTRRLAECFIWSEHLSHKKKLRVARVLMDAFMTDAVCDTNTKRKRLDDFAFHMGEMVDEIVQLGRVLSGDFVKPSKETRKIVSDAMWHSVNHLWAAARLYNRDSCTDLLKPLRVRSKQ